MIENVEMIERDMSLADLATMLSIDARECLVHDLDDLGIEIETPTGFKRVSSYVVKSRTIGWQVGELLASPVHRVLSQDGKWTYMRDMPGAVQTGEMINVVDVEVPDGECYNANGFVNHNTTPGGWN